METLKKCLDEGLMLFSFADDMGFKQGTITNSKFYEEYIFPRYRKMNDLIHKAGGFVYLHSEGNITDLFPQIIDAKFDGVQGLTVVDGIDIAMIKEKYGDKITLMGGLCHSPLLDQFTPEKVKEEVNRSFNLAGKNGRFIVGPSAKIDKNCKLENIIAFMDAAHKCKY
jgi:uroporphyrinogen decarboxylase